MSTRDDATPRHLRRGAVIASILTLAWLLAGCSSSSEDAGYSGGGDAAYDEETQAGDTADGGGFEGAAATDDRELIITGSMFMTVDDPISAADRAASIVERAGGRIDARNETAPTSYDGGSAWLVLRIPANGLDGAVDALRTLGTVDEYSTNSSDVTVEVRDLEAEISTLRASTARIAALLADAQDIKDIITLEDELAGRQARLESLEARQRGLDDQVSMSTIDLTLTTEPVVYVDDSPRSFWDGLVSGWNGLTAFISGALVVTGVLLPWIAVATLIGAVVLIAVRASRARKAGAATAPAPSPVMEHAAAPAVESDGNVPPEAPTGSGWPGMSPKD